MAYTLKRIECWTKKRRNKKTEFTEIKIVNQMNCFPSPEASKTKQAHCNIWPQRRRNTNTAKKKEEMLKKQKDVAQKI